LNLNKIMDVAVHAMAERKTPLFREKGFILNHGKRVGNLAVNLRKRVAPNDPSRDEIIFAGGVFHDVGKGIGHHSETGAALVHELLRDVCPERERAEIAEIVLLHNQRETSDPHPMAAKLVQDADILDHMGTMEVWLKFFFDAHADHSPERTLEYWQGQAFKEHRNKMRHLLNFEISRKIYDERVQFEQRFIQRFAVEADGEIFEL